MRNRDPELTKGWVQFVPTLWIDTQGFDENKKAARAGGKIAGDARKQLELKSGKSVVTGDNFLPENKRKELKNNND